MPPIGLKYCTIVPMCGNKSQIVHIIKLPYLVMNFKSTIIILLYSRLILIIINWNIYDRVNINEKILKIKIQWKFIWDKKNIYKFKFVHCTLLKKCNMQSMSLVAYEKNIYCKSQQNGQTRISNLINFHCNQLKYAYHIENIFMCRKMLKFIIKMLILSMN